MSPWHQDRCPTCRAWKDQTSKLCDKCQKDVRLKPLKLKWFAGHKREILGGVRLGAVVCYGDEWGVVEASLRPSGGNDHRNRVIYFWDSPPRRVSMLAVVQTAPYRRVRHSKAL